MARLSGGKLQVNALKPKTNSNGGISVPAAAAPIARAPVYQAPIPATRAAQAYVPPAQANYGGGGGGGYAAPAAPAPMAAPKPPRMSDDQWLAGDSEFQAQDGEFNRALGEFRSRIDKKKKNFEDDYKQSEGVTNENKARSLASLGEDFAARGMSNSGVFDQARTEGESNFTRQLANLLTVKNRSDQAATDDLADYEQENTMSKGNARRNALARFANSQNLM